MKKGAKKMFENMCRTCMKSLKAVQDPEAVIQQYLDEIPVGNNVNKTIRTTIMELLYSVQPLIVAELDDGLPGSICSECVDKLVQTYEFLKTYRDSDFKYRHFLKFRHLRTKDQENSEVSVKVKGSALHEQGEEEHLQLNDKSYKDDDDDDGGGGGVVSSIDDNNENLAMDVEENDEMSYLMEELEEEYIEEHINESFVDDLEKEYVIICEDNQPDNDDGEPEDIILYEEEFGELLQPPEDDIKKEVLKESKNTAPQSPATTQNQNFLSKNIRQYNYHPEIAKFVNWKETPKPDEDGKFPCTECYMILDNATTWTNHMKEHARECKPKLLKKPPYKSNGEKYQCEYCEKSFVNKRCYTNHVEGHTNTSLYKCETCGQEFTQMSKYNWHLKDHLEDQRHLCVECGKTFKAAYILRVHMQRHRGERTKQCPKCPKKFYDHGSLYQHMSVHATEKPYVCEICDHAFSFPHLLRVHIKKYHTAHRFKCEECDKSFPTSSALKKHMFRHTGSKPATCKFCNRSFASITKRHLSTHLGNQIYLCDLCPLRFPSKKEKFQHFASHNDDDEQTKARLLQEREESEKTFYERMGLTVMAEEEEDGEELRL